MHVAPSRAHQGGARLCPHASCQSLRAKGPRTLLQVHFPLQASGPTSKTKILTGPCVKWPFPISHHPAPPFLKKNNLF